MIEKEVDCAAIGGVAREEQFVPLRQGIAVGQGGIVDVLGRLGQGVAVELGVPLGVDDVGDGAIRANAGRNGRVFDPGKVIARRQIKDEPRGNVRLEVQLGAIADSILGVQKARGIHRAADGGKLLVLDVEII